MKNYTLLFFLFGFLLSSCSANVHYRKQVKDSSSTSFFEGQVLVGESSYYGPKFHGRKTANGETFDMYKLTAAHRTMPFGTIIQVTNLANRKSVKVRVNDRGPFAKNRILDLSYGAAKRIGLDISGVAKVQIRILQLGK